MKFRKELGMEGLVLLVDGKIVVKDGVYNGIRAAKFCRREQ